MSWLNDVGFMLSNAGLTDEVEAEIREKHPGWDDKQVIKEMQKTLKKATLFNAKNKKVKKSKKEKEPKWL